MSSLERRPLIVMTILVLAAFGLVLFLRGLGFLQSLELKTYDAFLRLAGERAGPSEPIVMVEYTEQDEAAFGFPLPDSVLADLLEAVANKEAVAIGLDLIRDRPEPQGSNKADFERLSRVFQAHPAIVGIVKDGGSGFDPPPALADRPTQVGSATILPDPDDRIRRGLLHFRTETGITRPSLALTLASRYLAASDIAVNRQGPDRVVLGEHPIRPFHPEASGFYGRQAGLGGGHQFLLTFPACANGFERYPIGDVLKDPAAVDLKGRIVLVGNTVQAARDMADVPVNCAGMIGGKMFGLHLHGQIISQLIGQANGSLGALESSAQRFGGALLGAVIDGGWIWFWTMLGGGLVLLMLSPFWLIVGVGAILAFLIASTLMIFAALDWWLPVVPPALGAALALTFAIVYVMTLARNEREHIMALFAGVVSKAVADDIWRRRDQQDDQALQLLTATVMFSDIKGFTTISEGLSEPVLADWLNDYMAVMVEIVADHGGVIEKFAGDGLTVEFGVPEPRTTEDEIDADARAAVDCALAMAECLPELNASWQAKNLPMIGIRIGIHTGPLMVGVIGSADRWQYSIIGDTANTAARLESYGKDDPKLGADVGTCRTLISEATLQRLGDDYQTDFVGEAALKGKTQTVGVYRLLAAVAAEP